MTLRAEHPMLVFCSTRAGSGVVPPENWALYGAEAVGAGWSAPWLLDIEQPAGVGGCSPTLLPNGALLFHSIRGGGPANSDIYYAEPKP